MNIRDTVDTKPEIWWSMSGALGRGPRAGPLGGDLGRGPWEGTLGGALGWGPWAGLGNHANEEIPLTLL